MRKIRKKRRRHGWMALLIIAAVLALAGTVAAFVFRVDTIEYIGDDHYSDEELTDKLFDGNRPNALSYFLVGHHHGISRFAGCSQWWRTAILLCLPEWESPPK